MFPARNISWKKMQVLKTQSFTHEVSYHRASACLSKAKREIQEGRTFYKQSRESGYRNDREMNQAGIVGRGWNIEWFRKPSLIYTRRSGARQIVWPSYERRMAETLEEKEAAGKTPSLTSRGALNILKTCPPDEKTSLSPLFFRRRSRVTGKNMQHWGH